MDGIHTGAGFGSFGSIRNTLMPSQNNLNTWLKTPTTDGKTLVNVEGTNATLTGISMANYDGTNDFTGGTFPTGFTKIDAGTKVEFTIEGLTIDGGDNAIIELGSLGGTGGNYAASGIGIYSTFTSGAGDGQLRLYVQENDATFISDRFGGTSINDGNPHTISVEFPTTSSVTYTVDGSATTVAFSAFDNASGAGDGGVTALSDSFQTNGNIYTLGASRNIGGTVNGSLYSACKLSNVKVSQGSDVIVHLPLAEGAGLRAFDISGNGAHGSHTGTTYTTHDGIASHNHQYGFATSPITEKSAFSGNNCTGAINADGHLVVTSTGNSNVHFTLGLPIQLTGSVTVSYDAVTSTGSGIACNMFLNDSSGTWLTSGSGANVVNGSFSQSATISSDQDIGLMFNVYSFFTTGQTITFSNLRVTQSDTCRLPAFPSATQQGLTLDGANDVIGFGSTISVTDFVYTSKFKLETTAGNNNVFFSSGSDSSSAMYMTLDGSRLAFQIGSNLIQNFPDGSGDGSDTNQRFIVAGYKTSASQTGTVNLRDGNVHTVVLTRSGTTIAVDIDDGTVTGTFTNMPTTAMTFTQFGKQMTAGAYVNGTIYSSKLEASGSVVHEFNLEENIGTTTIKDSSTNSNDGTLSNATLTSAWGQRIVDTSGTLVNCNYTGGDTSLIGESGTIHNNSECTLNMGSDTISGSNATSGTTHVNHNNQFFGRIEGGKVTEALFYGSAISGADLQEVVNHVKR